MAMPDDFQLGLLPERKMDWRTLATSYGFEILLVLLLLNLGMIWPDRLNIVKNYHITELIPIPRTQPRPFRMKKPAPTPSCSRPHSSPRQN